MYFLPNVRTLSRSDTAGEGSRKPSDVDPPVQERLRGEQPHAVVARPLAAGPPPPGVLRPEPLPGLLFSRRGEDHQLLPLLARAAQPLRLPFPPLHPPLLPRPALPRLLNLHPLLGLPQARPPEGPPRRGPAGEGVRRDRGRGASRRRRWRLGQGGAAPFLRGGVRGGVLCDVLLLRVDSLGGESAPEAQHRHEEHSVRSVRGSGRGGLHRGGDRHGVDELHSEARVSEQGHLLRPPRCRHPSRSLLFPAQSRHWKYKQVLSVEEKPEIDHGGVDGEPHPVIRRWGSNEQRERGSGPARPALADVPGPVESVRPREAGEAQVQPEDPVLGHHGSQEDERRRFVERPVCLPVKRKSESEGHACDRVLLMCKNRALSFPFPFSSFSF